MELSSLLQACGEKQIYKIEVSFPINTQVKKEHLLTWKWVTQAHPASRHYRWRASTSVTHTGPPVPLKSPHQVFLGCQQGRYMSPQPFRQRHNTICHFFLPVPVPPRDGAPGENANALRLSQLVEPIHRGKRGSYLAPCYRRPQCHKHTHKKWMGAFGTGIQMSRSPMPQLLTTAV